MTKFAPLTHAEAAPGEPALALSDVTILIVDDSAACRMVQAAMAKALGASADTAETAIQTMAQSAARPYDLIILDIGLADADGRVLTRTLRETPNGVAAAILCISGLGGDKREQGALDAGADGFAEKPFPSIAAFCDTALTTLRKRRGEATDTGITSHAAGQGPGLSSHVRACALDDLERARGRIFKAVAEGDLPGMRRAAHFISGVAGLIGDRTLDAASRALQSSKGDSGALRGIESVLELTHAAEHSLRAAPE